MRQHQIVDLTISPVRVEHPEVIGYGFHRAVTDEIRRQLTSSE